MYGSVSRWRVKEGQQQEFEKLFGEVASQLPPGGRTLLVLHSEADSQEYWTAGCFDSKEAYTANSNTPEQDDRFRRLRALLVSDPEWHDGEIPLTLP
jgi:heme-degrading monooxygenase HmoA